MESIQEETVVEPRLRRSRPMQRTRGQSAPPARVTPNRVCVKRLSPTEVAVAYVGLWHSQLHLTPSSGFSWIEGLRTPTLPTHGRGFAALSCLAVLPRAVRAEKTYLARLA